MSEILDLITGPLGALGAAAVAALAWLLDRRWQRSKGRSEGRTEAQTEAKVKDYENAVNVRRRAADADGNGMHPDDDTRGYRDD